MKRLMYLMIPVLAIVIISCKKNSDQAVPVNSHLLTVTRVTNVERKQPDTFSVTNPANATVKWNVVPPTGVWYSSAGNKAYMRFNSAGTYKVYASFGGNLDSTIITVDSTIYNGDTTLPGTTYPMDSTVNNIPPADSTGNNNHDTSFSFLGGQVNIIPAVVADSFSSNGTINGSDLILNATSVQTYPNASPQLMDSVWYQSNASNVVTGIYISYASVYLPGGVSASNSAAAKKSDYFRNLASGTYNLTILIGGNTYTGSFIKNANTYTFTWQNTGSVNISPLTVSL